MCVQVFFPVEFDVACSSHIYISCTVTRTHRHTHARRVTEIYWMWSFNSFWGANSVVLLTKAYTFNVALEIDISFVFRSWYTHIRIQLSYNMLASKSKTKSLFLATILFSNKNSNTLNLQIHSTKSIYRGNNDDGIGIGINSKFHEICVIACFFNLYIFSLCFSCSFYLFCLHACSLPRPLTSTVN